MPNFNRDPVVRRYWYSIDWDVETLWGLDLPVSSLSINSLIWHMDVPLWPYQGQDYSVTPSEVLNAPTKFAVEYNRIQAADLDFPLEVYFHLNRWMILDGVHRLAKAPQLGVSEMQVRHVPEDTVRKLDPPI